MSHGKYSAQNGKSQVLYFQNPSDRPAISRKNATTAAKNPAHNRLYVFFLSRTKNQTTHGITANARLSHQCQVNTICVNQTRICSTFATSFIEYSWFTFSNDAASIAISSSFEYKLSFSLNTPYHTERGIQEKMIL